MGFWTMAYGFLILVALLLVWGSRQHHLQKLGLVLLATWAASNVAVTTYGLGRSMYVQPGIDALAAIVAAAVGVKARSPTALVVVLLFVAGEVVHAGASLTTFWGGYFHYATLNVIFALQVLVVGGAGGLGFQWDGLARSHSWTGLSRSRR